MKFASSCPSVYNLSDLSFISELAVPKTAMSELSLTNVFSYIRNNHTLIFRYGVSGLSGVIANLLVFTYVVEVYGVWYINAAVLGFIAAYLVTFTMHKFWTFAKTSRDRTLIQGWLYLLSALATLAINAALLYVQVEGLGIWPVLAQTIALLISAVLSFLFTSQVTFHIEEDRLEKLYRFVLIHSERPWFVPAFLIVVGVCFMTIRLTFMPVVDLTDAPQYIASAQYIAGDGGEFLGHRFLKPLSSSVVVFLAGLVKWNYDFALLLQAQLSYFALILAVYWFGIELFRSRKKAALLSLLVMGTYPILRYGLAPLIESGAWALYFVALAALIRWSRTLETRWFWCTSLALLAGVLWKEYAVLAGLVFGLVILCHVKLTWREKMHALLQASFLILLPWALWQWHVHEVFHYSYIDWLSIGSASVAYEATYNVRAVTKSLIMIIGLSWPFVLLAWWKRREFPREAWKFMLLLLLPSFGFLLWGYVSSRLFYSLVPLLAPLAVVGLGVFERYRTRLLVVVCIGIANLCLVWLSYQSDIRERINIFTYGEQQQSPSQIGE